MKVLITAKSALFRSKNDDLWLFLPFFRIFGHLENFFREFVSIFPRVSGSRKTMPLSVLAYLSPFKSWQKRMVKIKRDLSFLYRPSVWHLANFSENARLHNSTSPWRRSPAKTNRLCQRQKSLFRWAKNPINRRNMAILWAHIEINLRMMLSSQITAFSVHHHLRWLLDKG